MPRWDGDGESPDVFSVFMMVSIWFSVFFLLFIILES
ncbi:hypothetical protein DES41_106432 [Pseudorhodoferax soli]|uniref:Uncharacterized protein n=1 Tax=Pseudorhodoferax soli TaxID=545864 RepID=A0A368XRA1_9BURK|nr:hypothetical protein DES41_106432 [Pseudorhodoferax soli]